MIFLISYNLAKTLLTINYYEEWNFDVPSFFELAIWESFILLSIIFSALSNENSYKIRFSIYIALSAFFYVIFFTFNSIEYTFVFEYYDVLLIDIIDISFLSILGYHFRLTPDIQDNYLSLQFEDIND